MTSKGICDPRFEGVRIAFEKNLAQDDIGASVAVTVDGQFVVDLWGGYSDAARTKLWEEDTILNVFSSTKTMMALSVLVAADRGEIALEAPVSQYWPEFAANGKEDVQVKHFLSHTSGVSGWDVVIEEEDLYDWERATSLLAAQAPWWEPGTASGYHALNQGYLVGEVMRRATGRTMGTYFREEIAEPLGADFHIGTDPRHFERIAELVAPETEIAEMVEVEPGSVAARTLASPRGFSGTEIIDWTRNEDWRSAEIGAGNGHGNARSMARVQTLLACGGTAFGRTLLSQAGCERVFEEQSNGLDLFLGLHMRFGMGYALHGSALDFGPQKRAHYWGGYGGSIVLVDQGARVCVTYAMNQLRADQILGDHRSYALVDAVYAALD
ncbi:MAG: serine hydrolase domain-containing protein [Pseudomonadota bacterium]|nr:serine hydrolase domain-containing protein [Pseudomonadota bacterium]